MRLFNRFANDHKSQQTDDFESKKLFTKKQKEKAVFFSLEI